jgi:hypothetical protein
MTFPNSSWELALTLVDQQESFLAFGDSFYRRRGKQPINGFLFT